MNDQSTRLVSYRWFGVLFGVALTYSIVRYHVFGHVDWVHFPLFILNKAISLAAVFLIAASYLINKIAKLYKTDPSKRFSLIKFCGQMGFTLAAIHVLMALLLFSPKYYPKFFLANGQLNLTGELSMAFGVAGLWALTITAIRSMPCIHATNELKSDKQNQVMGYICLTLTAGHVLTMGLAGWLKPSAWHGYLPPISLVAFIAILVVLLVKLRKKG